MRTLTMVAAVLAGSAPAMAQTSVDTAAIEKFGPVRKLLVEGYEIKAGFSDNNGGAYMLLQKTTSAYLCHSSPAQVCEKLN